MDSGTEGALMRRLRRDQGFFQRLSDRAKMRYMAAEGDFAENAHFFQSVVPLAGD
jgi:hypothetical protein